MAKWFDFFASRQGKLIISCIITRKWNYSSIYFRVSNKLLANMNPMSPNDNVSSFFQRLNKYLL